MKKYRVFMLLWLALVSLPLFAQEPKQKATGFGIEAGVGYNTAKIAVTDTLGANVMLALNYFWMQPCIRVHYDVFLKQLGTSSTLILKPFLGYYTFGGKSKPDDIGNAKIFAFGSIEAGVGLAFDIKNFFQITPVVKGQYIISANKRSIGISNIPSQDIKKDFKTISTNAGLQFRYKYKHFTVGAEAWLGLTNFNKQQGKTAKENNFRLLLGYEF